MFLALHTKLNQLYQALRPLDMVTIPPRIKLHMQLRTQLHMVIDQRNSEQE